MPFFIIIIMLTQWGYTHHRGVRKPTLTDQYLQWHSQHHIAAKYSVITLTHRAKIVCSTPKLLGKEIKHLREVLSKWKYPRWVLNRIHNRNTKQNPSTTNNNNKNNQ